MNYDELKKHGGFITLDANGRVMRYTNHPVLTGPEKDKKRISVELIFSRADDSKPDEEVADWNMNEALRAGIQFAACGYSIDVVRGELLGEKRFIEPAAFAFVWKDVPAALSEQELHKLVDRLQDDADEIGGDYGHGFPGVDVDQFPAFWHPALQGDYVGPGF
jgi:hypothetical protein